MATSRTGMTRWHLLPLAFCLVCLLLPLPLVQAEQRDPFASLFGHTAFRAHPGDIPLKLERNWRKVLKAEQDAPSLRRDTSHLLPPDAPHWLYLADKAPAMDEMRLLCTVNAFFNKFRYASDMENYGVKDQWHSPAKFFSRRAGDCKAYTLAKYFALRALGMQDDKLRIVLVHLPRRKLFHSMLAVDTANGVFILDNLTRPIDTILPHNKFSAECIPLFMFNEKGRWTFRQDLQAMLADQSLTHMPVTAP